MEDCRPQLSNLIKESYLQQGLDSLHSRSKLLKSILSTRQLPAEGIEDSTLEYFLQQFAMMDSNNFLGNVGVGEREGRVFSSLVAKRHAYLSHGIGRSGDIAEQQPKAAGSSVIYKLTNHLVLHAMHIMGFKSLKKALVVPMATGMSVALALLTLKQARPNAKYVIWTRIDQKSCFKAILTCGLTPIVVDNIISHDEIVTDVQGVVNAINEVGDEQVLCVLSTTSCFAPRRPDRIGDLASTCKKFNIPHVINNAYGLQCPLIAKLVNRAVSVGRVDYVVQSLDKNFMVPVGGAIIASPDASLIKNVSKVYPGRASSAPIVDLFLTLLSMGQNNLKSLLESRLSLLQTFIDGLQRVATEFGERVLVSPCNTISIGISLSQSLLKIGSDNYEESAQFIGSMLYKRSVSGSRVIVPTASTSVSGHFFSGWGSSATGYHSAYMTAACALGLKEAEIRTFLSKLSAVFAAVHKAHSIPPTLPNNCVDKEAVDSTNSTEKLSSHWLNTLTKKAKEI